MSSGSAWDDRPTPADQMSPRSYHCHSPDGSTYSRSAAGPLGDHAYESDGLPYDPPHHPQRRYGSSSDHGSVKNPEGDEQGITSLKTPHDVSPPRGYGSNHDRGRKTPAYSNHGSDHGSVKGYGSHHGSLKDFASDHGSGRKFDGYGSDRGSVKNDHGDTKDSGSEYGHHQQHSEHGGSGAHYESERESADGGNMSLWRPGMSWIDRRAFYMGEACAIPPDWENHPILRQVQPQDQQAYRQSRIEEWLSTAHKRHPNEKFGAYIWRASALAGSELKQRKKQCFGDEYTNPVDKFVMRLFYGMKLRLERSESVILGVDEETFVLEILREECEDLSKNGQLYPDQRSIQYTPLLAPEMNSSSMLQQDQLQRGPYTNTMGY